MIPELIGYADRISAAPGDRVAFKVSTSQPDYEVAVVRLIRGDPSPPGFKEEVVATVGTKPGRRQHAATGSYGVVPESAALPALSSFTVQMWIWPTTPKKGSVQGLLSKWDADAGIAFVIGEGGDLGLWLGDGDRVERVHTGIPLRPREWYFVAATFDAGTRIVRLHQTPLAEFAIDGPTTVERQVPLAAPGVNGTPIVLGAMRTLGSPAAPAPHLGGYNGKIEAPLLAGRALAGDELGRIAADADPSSVVGDDLVAWWDFTGNAASAAFADRGPRALHGHLVNMPMRAAAGRLWNAEEYDYKRAPGQYGAVHFHDDDLEDCRWETDFEWQVPADARSGFYAARLRSGPLEDHVPFFVRPRRGAPVAKVAVLAPTMTYLAYADERLGSVDRHAAVYPQRPMVLDKLDHYLLEHPEFAMSIYDVHADGSGCCYSTHLRPITNMRPKYRMWQVAGSRHFAADLNLVDWLEEKRIGYEVITDHDLHAEGKALLDGFNVVITGTHPEYWTWPMHSALRAYLGAGGRLMYLGGNGFYWVTGVDPERPHVIEVRRGLGGSRAWNSEVGELYMSSTGELGGLWRHRGLAPNRVVGIGFTGMGYDSPSPAYRRAPGSFDERAAFIFEGIAADEVIGDFGSVLGSAAGDEIDRIDFDLGSPPHILRLASAEGYGHPYMPVVEDHIEMSPIVVKALEPNLRSDLAYFETPNDGAVFSAGAITWCASLAHNGYDNNVSRITENVLRRFMEDKPR